MASALGLDRGQQNDERISFPVDGPALHTAKSQARTLSCAWTFQPSKSLAFGGPSSLLHNRCMPSTSGYALRLSSR